jgi:hypothetical protein
MKEIPKAEMLRVMNKAIFECTWAMSEKEITVLCKVRAFIKENYPKPNTYKPRPATVRRWIKRDLREKEEAQRKANREIPVGLKKENP